MTALQNMWFSFFGLFLMFVSAGLTVLSQKLPSFWRVLLLVISFLCLVVAGLIVFMVVIRGPLAE
ncbi:Protein of unknown function [Alteribacillus persepolensis]|uniref:DUF2768 domain-containing protein n=1 Tax=Alteribacillus persepolensis TaxID=568899 RepID=A0A1G7ZH33_9BACI|nr:DUF2768 domain-containing protein [Alteribacillus persepolensis]SDH08008.1 Protein of unknown function [Alteribacillus persepolensis]